ncbi:MAG: YqhA family protein [Chloroflexi bacterium]|nr:YqhA family protein [Chloroflexota bacterium]
MSTSPSVSAEAPEAPEPGDHPVRRLLSLSRLLILLSVVGSFVASATLMIYGVLRAIGIIYDLVASVGSGVLREDAYGKMLIADTIALIDMFLLGTVLFIVAAGQYQLFIDPRAQLPTWLRIRSLDDLKSLLTGVIIVALLVTFLGAAVSWKGGADILALGLAIAGVVIAANISMRNFGHHGPSNLTDELHP